MTLKKDQRIPPRSEDTDRTVFNTKLSQLYEDDWFDMVETFSYTPDKAYWVLTHLESGVTRYTKSDLQAKWAEELPNIEVSLMWVD